MVSGAAIYTDVRIQHDREWADLKQDTTGWFRRRGYSMFHKRLQDEKTKQVGWFLFSHPAFNPTALCLAIEK